MEVCIVKPDRIFLQEEVEKVMLPTTTGYIGILNKHAPLVTTVDNGVLSICQGGTWKMFAVLAGFATIKENRVNILCTDIEDAGDIDITEAEMRVTTARTGMETAETRKTYIENELTFNRERGRVKAHTMWNKSAGGPPVFGK
jgi:F-type H+-transporting ATPase subunit epsilon